jgi:hypothetical protein
LCVDGVPESQRCGEDNETVERELQRIKMAVTFVFQGRLVPHKHDAKLSLDHAVLTQVGNPQHKGRLAVERRDNHRFAEQNARGGRENRTKMRPVITASQNMPAMISIIATTWP